MGMSESMCNSTVAVSGDATCGRACAAQVRDARLRLLIRRSRSRSACGRGVLLHRHVG
jgi:hypothetical protein